MSERNWQEERHQQKLKDAAELENVQRFHRFLQGEVPKGVVLGRNSKGPRLTAKRAMTVIWALQECFHLLSDRFKMCADCHNIYDSDSEGGYAEKTGNNYCGSCDLHHAKELGWDRE